MCPVGKIAAGEISFLPLGTSDTSNLVKKVIDSIREADWSIVWDMSTFVRGKGIVISAAEGHLYGHWMGNVNLSFW